MLMLSKVTNDSRDLSFFIEVSDFVFVYMVWTSCYLLLTLIGDFLSLSLLLKI